MSFTYKICPACKEVFKKNPKHSTQQWDSRKFCTKKCEHKKTSSIKKPSYKVKTYSDYLAEWKKSKFRNQHE